MILSAAASNDDYCRQQLSYLFLRDLGYRGVQTFLAYFMQINWKLEALEIRDLGRIHEIAETYTSAKFDVVDCCIMTLAERLDITRVATFDQRDFSVFKPHHCDFLELLP